MRSRKAKLSILGIMSIETSIHTQNQELKQKIVIIHKNDKHYPVIKHLHGMLNTEINGDGKNKTMTLLGWMKKMDDDTIDSDW